MLINKIIAVTITKDGIMSMNDPIIILIGIFDNHLEQCVALNIHCMCFSVLCCFDAVDWVTGRTRSL